MTLSRHPAQDASAHPREDFDERQSGTVLGSATYVAARHPIDDNLLLLKVKRGAGYSGASGLYDRVRESAFDDSFKLHPLGVAGR